MPIVNCVVSSNVKLNAEKTNSVISLWEKYSHQSSQYMTINFVPNAGQRGARFDVMAFLYLPTLWSAESRNLLQLGLAKALAESLSVPLPSVQVITSIVQSGCVVENGELVEW